MKAYDCFTYCWVGPFYLYSFGATAIFRFNVPQFLFKGHSVQPANYTLSEATNNSHFSQLIEINCSSG